MSEMSLEKSAHSQDNQKPLQPPSSTAIEIMPPKQESKLIGRSHVPDKKYLLPDSLKKEEEEAEKGDFKAQYKLATCFENGDGVTQDFEKAFRFYELAAKQDCCKAQFKLGMCYATGKGTEKNEAEALKFIQLAANQGLIEAQQQLILYYNSNRFDYNYSRFEKAIRQHFYLQSTDDLKKNVFYLLTAFNAHHHTVGEFYKSLSISDRIYFLKKIMPFILYNNNSRMLSALINIDKQLEHPVLELIKSSLTKTQKEFMEKLILMDDLKPGFKKTLLNEFIQHGNFTHQGIKLTMAQIAVRKPYKFNPTVISPDEDFSRYVNAIKKIADNFSERPLREVFILGDPSFPSGTHWVSGIIEIDIHNKAKMVLIDSIGDEIYSVLLVNLPKYFQWTNLYGTQKRDNINQILVRSLPWMMHGMHSE